MVAGWHTSPIHHMYACNRPAPHPTRQTCTTPALARHRCTSPHRATSCHCLPCRSNRIPCSLPCQADGTPAQAQPKQSEISHTHLVPRATRSHSVRFEADQAHHIRLLLVPPLPPPNGVVIPAHGAPLAVVVDLDASVSSSGPTAQPQAALHPWHRWWWRRQRRAGWRQRW